MPSIFIVGLEPLLLPDRGPVIDEFSSTNDLGVTVLGRPFGGKLEYYAAVMNGEGSTSVRNVHPQPLVIGRLVVNPLGPVEYSQTPQLGKPKLPFRIAFGVNGYTNELRDTEVARDPITGMDEPFTVDRRDIGGGGEVALHWRLFNAQAEALYRRRIRSVGRSERTRGSCRPNSRSELTESRRRCRGGRRSDRRARVRSRSARARRAR